ncbi:MAG: hypothetical protein II649_09480 [Kiritimatiellae bacterium]|nr:hypothetical protein [Kiritimatiellia bacterium]
MSGIQDRLLRFSTPGHDRYADGSLVRDGECYALVWSPKGTAFAGFNADGTPVSSRDRVVLAGALAQDGKCRDAVFQIPAAEYEVLKGGEWAVCLVDTRNLNGVPAGVKDGRPVRVNRWVAVNGGVDFEPTSADNLATAKPGRARLGASSTASLPQGRVCANVLSAVPPDVQPPQITALEVGDGEVWLAVAGTVPFLDYTIISGETPDNLKPDYFSEVVEGDSGAEIEIGTVKSAKRRFFRIKRAE